MSDLDQIVKELTEVTRKAHAFDQLKELYPEVKADLGPILDAAYSSMSLKARQSHFWLHWHQLVGTSSSG